MKIAIHQPNFVPWMPFFYKMAMADKFILLGGVQFEKNGFQNRFKYKDKWITKPVKKGNTEIYSKKYTDGLWLYSHNYDWIKVIKDTLGIKTQLILDCSKKQFKDSNKATKRLINIIGKYGGTTYITNPKAKDKYLNEEMILDRGIDIQYCKVPRNLNVSIFEMFEKYGIEGTIKQLPKRR